jgi:hypothetical protein
MRLSKLTAFATNVILLIDEVYICSKLEYSGGNIIGQCEDGLLAKTVLSFMISSVCGSYRDVVHLIPVNRLTTDMLYSHFMDVLKFVESVGFSVVAICVDNHPVNRSFYVSRLCGGTLKSYIPHPCRLESPLFLLFDMTHNIKNVFNNYESRRIFILPPPSPPLSTFLGLPNDYALNPTTITANFDHIQQLYSMEADKPVKAAHKLKRSCFNPTSIEKTSVKFASAIFHESTHNALTHYSTSSPDRHSWRETSMFLQLIVMLWKIVNVKTPRKGLHKRDDAQSPIASPTDWKLKFLEEIANYISKWKQSGRPGLSRETFLALQQTVSALVPLCRYLLSVKSFHYVLLGFMQSDNLEGRFGWYRQLSGGNYFISLRQVRESEKKIKIISLLQSSGFTVSEATIAFDKQVDTLVDDNIVTDIVSNLPYCEPPNIDDSNIIFFIAGYIARSVSTLYQCSSCSHLMKNSDRNIMFGIPETDDIRALFNQLNRGGLCDPSSIVYRICVRCWCVFSSIKSAPKLSHLFLSSPNTRPLFVAIMLKILLDEEIVLLCENNHDINAAVVEKFFNCMAKNWIAGISQESSCLKKRKVQKMSG